MMGGSKGVDFKTLSLGASVSYQSCLRLPRHKRIRERRSTLGFFERRSAILLWHTLLYLPTIRVPYHLTMAPPDDAWTAEEPATPDALSRDDTVVEIIEEVDATTDDGGPQPRWWQSVRQSVQSKLSKSATSEPTDTTTTTNAQSNSKGMSEYQTLRPGQVAITVVKEEEITSGNELAWLQAKLGLTFVERQKKVEPTTDNDEDNHSELVESIVEESLTTPEMNNNKEEASGDASSIEEHSTPVLVIGSVEVSSPLASILQPLIVHRDSDASNGTFLSKVNDEPCDSVQDLVNAIKLAEAGQSITIKCQANGGHDKLVQAVVMKPTPESLLGIGLVHSKHAGGQMLLTVNEIVPSSYLEYSTIDKGDLVLAINGQPCHDMAPEGAAYFLRSTELCVSILALKPGPSRTQRWLRHAKRAGVAVGGGAMVGVGLVFIPTLPPPFGEVLIAGGVSFLATEFEGPRRVVRSCRDSLEGIVGREETTNADEVTTSEPEHGNDEYVVDDSPNTKEVEGNQASVKNGDVPKKKTVKDRLKNFGRRHVLPFLDQVVGDHPSEERPESKEKSVPHSNGTDEAVNENASVQE